MPIVSMRGLAELHNIDKNLVRRTIAESPDFPYIAPPENNPRAGYQFDTELVDSWLLLNDWARGNTQYRPDIHDRLAKEAEEKLEKQAKAGLVPANLPESVRRMVKIKEEKNKKSDVQTALLQLELDKKRGRLVDRDEVVMEFAPKIARLAKGLELFPNLFGKRFGLDDEQIRQMRDYMDELRAALTRDDGGILSESYQPVAEDEDDE